MQGLLPISLDWEKRDSSFKRTKKIISNYINIFGNYGLLWLKIVRICIDFYELTGILVS